MFDQLGSEYVSNAGADFGTRLKTSIIPSNEGKEKYLKSKYGDANVRKDSGGNFQMRQGSDWTNFDEKGVSLSDIADLAGPVISAIGSGVGAAFGGIPGGMLGNAGAEGWRELAAQAMGGGRNSSGDVAKEVGVAAVTGGLEALGGKVIQKGVDLAKPWLKPAQKAVSEITAAGGLNPVVKTVPVRSQVITKEAQMEGLDDLPVFSKSFTSGQNMRKLSPTLQRADAVAAGVEEVVPVNTSKYLGQRVGLLSAANAGGQLMAGNPIPVARIAAAEAGLQGTNVISKFYRKAGAKKLAQIANSPEGFKALQELAKPGIKAELASQIISQLTTMFGEEAGIDPAAR
jgi:hypothetical protein